MSVSLLADQKRGNVAQRALIKFNTSIFIMPNAQNLRDGKNGEERHLHLC